MKRIGWIVACWFVLASSQLSAGVEAKHILVASHVLNTMQQKTLNAWLKQHPNLRLASIEDCECDDEVREIRNSTSTPEPDFDPYRVVGDFNGDGSVDFAVVLLDIDKKYLQDNFVLVIFNGSRHGGDKSPAFIQRNMQMIGYGLFFYPQQPNKPKPIGIAVGLFNSEIDSWLIPDEHTYEWERVDYQEENVGANPDQQLSAVIFTEPEMVKIPSGKYEMDVVNSNGKMEHIVNIIQSFEIGRTEVTQGLWRSVMGVYENPSFYSSCGDSCPVENVNWYAVQEFIRRLNIKTGKQYRLPTEIEWEYACQGGARNRYCGSDNADLVSWHKDNSANQTHPVGLKQANALGLYDMAGNVLEWVDGNFEFDPKLRLLRGGSFRFKPLRVHVADRNASDPADQSPDFGFRLAISK